MATISTVAGQDDIFIIQVPGAKVGDMVKVLDMDGAAHKMQLVPPIGSAHAACSPVAAAPHAPRTATMCEGRRGMSGPLASMSSMTRVLRWWWGPAVRPAAWSAPGPFRPAPRRFAIWPGAGPPAPAPRDMHKRIRPQ